jgi:phosphate transport system substrate-binding protein
MNRAKLVGLFVVLVLALSAFGVVAQDQTIVDIAAGNPDFSTLVSLVQAAGLAETLAGEGPFTVFAPTNDAFAAVPQPILDYLASDVDALTRVLTYHVVPGTVMAADVAAGEVASVEGSPITVSVSDMGVMVDQASVTATDIVASNGVIHVIDSVILPPAMLPEITPAAVSGDIITAGSSTVGPLTVALANAFSQEGYTGNISVAIIGSGAGFERFCEAGETDIANASRAIKQEEIDACAALATARTPLEFRVATDALAVVVNPQNEAVSNLSVEQLALAFGQAETWADVDPSFPAEPILRFIPGTDSGTFDYFVEEIFEEDESAILAAANTQLSEDDNVLVEGVANNPWAIGFFGYAYYAENADSLKLVAVDGVEATKENVDNTSYPLARPLFIYSDAGIIAAKPQVGDFINYYLTDVNLHLISQDVVLEVEGGTETVDVAYFAANDYALNAARWLLAAVQGSGM